MPAVGAKVEQICQDVKPWRREGGRREAQRGPGLRRWEHGRDVEGGRVMLFHFHLEGENGSFPID